MTEYSKYNIIYRLQRWLDSVPGQTFLNYAYSWGASIVILGTLFKLTHLPGANIMLYFGMGTEVIVFFISAFDRPFDKTAIGKEIPTHVNEEGVVVDDNGVPVDNEYEVPADAPHAAPQGVQGGNVVYINGGGAQPQAAPSGISFGSDNIQPSDGEQTSADGEFAASRLLRVPRCSSRLQDGLLLSSKCRLKWKRPQATMLRNSKNSQRCFLKYLIRVRVLHATQRRWRISTAPLPVYARFTRCS